MVVSGTVTNATTSAPIAGVVISIGALGISATTNAEGAFELEIPIGVTEDFTLSASASGYQTPDVLITLVDGGEAVVQDFELVAV